MSRHSILCNAQREALLTPQFDLNEREVARYWTLSDQDLLRIDRRRHSNRFGFAVQLCLLRFPAGHRMGAHHPHWQFSNCRRTLLLLAAIPE